MNRAALPDGGVISTDRLILRPPAYRDGPALHRLLSDPKNFYFSPQAPLAELAYTRFMIVEWAERRSHGFLTFLAARKGWDEQPIGLLHVGADEEIGGFLSDQASGRGLASEGLQAVVTALDLRQAWTIIDAEHLALIHLLSKVSILPAERLPSYRVHPQISAQKRDCVLLRQQEAA